MDVVSAGEVDIQNNLSITVDGNQSYNTAIDLNNNNLTLNGQAGNDSITVNTLSTSIGTGQLSINGNAGNDTMLVSNIGAGTNVVVDGGTDNDTIIGPNINATWSLNTPMSGTINLGSVTYSNVENLTGNSQDDTFVFDDGVAIPGNIDGGAHITGDTLDYSNYSSVVSANFATGIATGIGGTFTRIEQAIIPNNPGGNGGSNNLNATLSQELLLRDYDDYYQWEQPLTNISVRTKEITAIDQIFYALQYETSNDYIAFIPEGTFVDTEFAELSYLIKERAKNFDHLPNIKISQRGGKILIATDHSYEIGQIMDDWYWDKKTKLRERVNVAAGEM